MQEPKIKNIKINRAKTARIKRGLAQQKGIKITINIDPRQSLGAVKREALSSGVPYQRLLNRIIKEGLSERRATESRLDRIERELKAMKKRLAA